MSTVTLLDILIDILTLPFQKKLIEDMCFRNYKCPVCGTEYRIPNSVAESITNLRNTIKGDPKDASTEAFTCPKCGYTEEQK